MSDKDAYPAIQLINISDKPQILSAGLNLDPSANSDYISLRLRHVRDRRPPAYLREHI